MLAAVSEALSEGEQVKIKDFGVFKTIAVDARKSVNVSTGGEHTIPAHRKVVFVPSREIAALINAPFAMFETVELGDDVEFEAEPQVPESITSPEPEQEMPEPDTELPEPEPEIPGPGVGSDMEEVIETDEDAESGVVYEIVSETDDGEPEECPQEEGRSEAEENQPEQESDEDEGDLNTEPMALYGPEAVGEDEDVDDNIEDDDDDQDDEDDHDEDEYEEDEPSSHRFLYGFLSGFATAAVVAFAVFFCTYYFEWDKAAGFGKAAPDDIIDTIAAPEPEPAMAVATSIVESASTTDAQEAAPTQPSDQKQYDTITKTRYLTTMAKDHYGNFNLWPYIYKENEAFLGHPDRIRPGTQVVIPPLSKYGVDPSNPTDIAKAKRLGVEIYSRYR